MPQLKKPQGKKNKRGRSNSPISEEAPIVKKKEVTVRKKEIEKIIVNKKIKTPVKSSSSSSSSSLLSEDSDQNEYQSKYDKYNKNKQYDNDGFDDEHYMYKRINQKQRYIETAREARVIRATKQKMFLMEANRENDDSWRFRVLGKNEQKDQPNLDQLDAEDKDCAICFDGITNDDLTLCKQCKKFLHGTCMEAWLKQNDTCPLCRGEWELEDEDQGIEINYKDKQKGALGLLKTDKIKILQ